LLYHTKNGQRLRTGDRNCITFIETIHEHKNLGVVQIGKKEFGNLDLYNFIKSALDKNMFSLVDIEKYPFKPIQLMPVLNLQNDVDKLSSRDKRLTGIKTGNYLLSLTLYLNGECGQQCEYCDKYYKQTPYCTRSKNEIDITDVEKLFSQLCSTNIKTIQITGGNIFKYGYFDTFLDLLNKYDFNAEFHIDINNLESPQIQLPTNQKVHVLIHFPFSEECLQKNVLANYEYHFIITNADEYEQASKIIEKHKINNSVIYPFFTKDNIRFFEENIFLSE
jgi:pseudo-rSAM protein